MRKRCPKQTENGVLEQTEFSQNELFSLTLPVKVVSDHSKPVQ